MQFAVGHVQMLVYDEQKNAEELASSMLRILQTCFRYGKILSVKVQPAQLMAEE